MRNIPKTSDYIEKARLGDRSAQKQLGILLIQSRDTLDEGTNWLKKAADSDADAMYLLGKVYLKKYNDVNQAFYWYEKAAQCNHVDAMIDVGAFYLFGYHVERNINTAIEWYINVKHR